MDVKTQSVLLKKIRLKKADSAYVYAIFESHEGVMSYTTLEHKAQDLYRDLELQIPPSRLTEAQELLSLLQDLVIELA